MPASIGVANVVLGHIFIVVGSTARSEGSQRQQHQAPGPDLALLAQNLTMLSACYSRMSPALALRFLSHRFKVLLAQPGLAEAVAGRPRAGSPLRLTSGIGETLTKLALARQFNPLDTEVHRRVTIVGEAYPRAKGPQSPSLTDACGFKPCQDHMGIHMT